MYWDMSPGVIALFLFGLLWFRHTAMECCLRGWRKFSCSFGALFRRNQTCNRPFLVSDCLSLLVVRREWKMRAVVPLSRSIWVHHKQRDCEPNVLPVLFPLTFEWWLFVIIMFIPSNSGTYCMHSTALSPPRMLLYMPLRLLGFARFPLPTPSL